MNSGTSRFSTYRISLLKWQVRAPSNRENIVTITVKDITNSDADKKQPGHSNALLWRLVTVLTSDLVPILQPYRDQDLSFDQSHLEPGTHRLVVANALMETLEKQHLGPQL